MHPPRRLVKAGTRPNKLNRTRSCGQPEKSHHAAAYCAVLPSTRDHYFLIIAILVIVGVVVLVIGIMVIIVGIVVIVFGIIAILNMFGTAVIVHICDHGHHRPNVWWALLS